MSALYQGGATDPRFPGGEAANSHAPGGFEGFPDTGGAYGGYPQTGHGWQGEHPTYHSTDHHGGWAAEGYGQGDPLFGTMPGDQAVTHGPADASNGWYGQESWGTNPEGSAYDTSGYGYPAAAWEQPLSHGTAEAPQWSDHSGWDGSAYGASPEGYPTTGSWGADTEGHVPSPLAYGQGYGPAGWGETTGASWDFSHLATPGYAEESQVGEHGHTEWGAHSGTHSGGEDPWGGAAGETAAMPVFTEEDAHGYAPSPYSPSEREYDFPDSEADHGRDAHPDSVLHHETFDQEAFDKAFDRDEDEPSPVGPATVPAPRGRRRSPKPKRTALLTVAAPSVAVLGVAGIAAATVSGPDNGGSDKRQEAADRTDQVAPSSDDEQGQSNKLDTQIAGLSQDAGDFANRASRTQERLDLKERQETEKKRKAAEAARKEAMRPKFSLPVKEHGLSATYGQAGVNWMSLHTGIDFPVSYGTPVLAATDGTVTTKYDMSYGNMVIVTAEDGTETWYCHLGSTKIRGGEVKAGDTIAYSGSSGNSTGPHLHFEVRPGGGSAINPLPWLQAKGLNPN
ncbi:M23 family metallopeptidase [Streptomyces sp. NPDC005438]|uniref:M23 family metallopeptidase n=1 Tax=Streptomyces sp. NPDC005438 TaxID=3156880 RepID=UPI0033BDC848